MAEAVSEAFWNLICTMGQVAQQVPGLAIVVRYVQRSYQNDPMRVLLELLLFTWALYYILKRDDSKEAGKLSEKEIDILVQEWEPEPLVPRSKETPSVDGGEEEGLPIIKGACTLHVTLTTGEKAQNWGSYNFLGLQNNPDVTEAAIQTVRQYGVGTCGPAGFYGSTDVHLELEKDIARLLNVEEAIVYAQGFMAVASVIPAFAKRGDILVADSGASFAIQTGLEISRSHVYYFEHNNMEDLERVLQQVDDECLRKKMPLSRRFIVVEGLYAKCGDKCPLPKLLEIKKRYRYRLIVDESFSFGCLGPRGLGISDYYGVPASDIEIITGSFSNAIGSSGGFCAGSHNVVDHQRLSSQAYCFSAALPALLTVTASLILQQIQSCPEVLHDLRRNMAVFNAVIAKSLPRRYVIVGDADSPFRFIRLATRHKDPNYEKSIINDIVKAMRLRGFLVTRDKHVAPRENFVPPPSLKICLSAGFTEAETDLFANTLINVLQSVTCSS